MATKVTTLSNKMAAKPKSAFTQLVERLFAENVKTIGNQGTIASVIGTAFASMSQAQYTWKREAFRDLLLHLEAQGCYALLRNTVCINALANMASFGNKLVREIKAWEKETLEVETQMSALIKHCFALYDVPEFMESVFYYENKKHCYWYIQLGRGESVLKLSSFPIKLTKKMAHEFKKAPANYNVEKAIRWAQAKGYGASCDMAETLAWSTLSEHFENEEFWAKVIKFLSQYNTLPYHQVQEVLFYIGNQFEANKSYSIKGRTWETLLKQSIEWHVEYHKKLAALNRADWSSCGITGLTKIVVFEQKSVEYKIMELTNSEALYDEGYEMSHCVAEYEYECVMGSSAIFSLRKKVAKDSSTLATIEIDVESKSIVQAKAKYNECISLEAETILVEWAKKENLTLCYDEYVEYPAQEHPNGEAHAFQRRNQDEINWKLILFILFLIIKACSALSR